MCLSIYSFQSHTCFRKLAMLTFLDLMSIIHGCSSIRQGVALRGGSFSRLRQSLATEFILQKRCMQNIPAVDEIFKIVRPANPICRLILKLRDRLTDNVRKEVDQAGARLHFGTIGWEGEAMLGHFEEGNTKRPDVRGDGIRLPGDSFGSHIVRGSDEGIGIALGAEFATDAKVAELHLAIAAQENVGRFDICGD